MFWLLGLLLQKLVYILASSLASSEQSLRISCDAVFQVWSPKNVHWIKHNSQVLDCAFFQQTQLIPQSYMGYLLLH